MNMMEIGRKFKTLKYFVDGYYNQSIDDHEFDDMIREFRDEEPESLVNALRAELAELQKLIDNGDRETFKKVEILLHDNSLRYIEFEDGQAFINRVLNVLDNKN